MQWNQGEFLGMKTYSSILLRHHNMVLFYVLCVSNIIFVLLSSKVHVSKATLDALGDTFCVEPGDGKSRSSILESEKIETFLITSRIIASAHS